jgi:hypothetical protein
VSSQELVGRDSARPSSARMFLEEMLNKLSDGAKHALIYDILSFAGALQMLLRDEKRMIAVFNYMEEIRRFHFGPDVFEQIERAERIARSLYE